MIQILISLIKRYNKGVLLPSKWSSDVFSCFQKENTGGRILNVLLSLALLQPEQFLKMFSSFFHICVSSDIIFIVFLYCFPSYSALSENYSRPDVVEFTDWKNYPIFDFVTGRSLVGQINLKSVHFSWHSIRKCYKCLPIRQTKAKSSATSVVQVRKAFPNGK